MLTSACSALLETGELRAVDREGLIAAWQVYADDQPVRKLMGEGNP